MDEIDIQTEQDEIIKPTGITHSTHESRLFRAIALARSTVPTLQGRGMTIPGVGVSRDGQLQFAF